jgi:AraC-like DNA-binding protein
MAFNGRFVLNMAHLAARQGGDIVEVIALSGKTMAELSEESCVVDDANYNAVAEHLAASTGDNYFGLHAGENLNLSAAGLIVQLAQTSETVKQALELCCEYANLGCSVLPMALLEEKDCYKITLTPNQLWRSNSEVSFQHTAAGVLAFTIKEYHSLTRLKQNPVEVHLTWSDRNGAAEYERVFGCPVHFAADQLAIVLSKDSVNEAVVTSDYNLLRVLVAHADELSSKRDHALGFASEVTQSIIKLVKPDFPTIEAVASHLNISARTLQRKLKEEGLSYKKLIDQLKNEFAISYLKRPELSIGEIAYLLSYADTSSFTRAFKGWTGKSPTEFRLIS